MDRRNFLETSLTLGAAGLITPSLLNKNNMIENNVNGLLVPAKNEMKLAAVLEELIINLDEGEKASSLAPLIDKEGEEV